MQIYDIVIVLVDFCDEDDAANLKTTVYEIMLSLNCGNIVRSATLKKRSQRRLKSQF